MKNKFDDLEKEQKKRLHSEIIWGIVIFGLMIIGMYVLAHFRGV